MVLVLVYTARPQPAWRPDSWQQCGLRLGPGFWVLPRSGASCPWLQAGPVLLTVFSSRQVYFFCHSSACSPSGLETCSTTCSSRPASESGAGRRGGLRSSGRRPVPGFWARDQPTMPPLPRTGQRRSYTPHGEATRPQNLVSSPGPVDFEDSSGQEPPLGPTGTGRRVAAGGPSATVQAGNGVTALGQGTEQRQST